MFKKVLVAVLATVLAFFMYFYFYHIKSPYINTHIIDECTRLSLTGELTFPEQIKKLMEHDIERYSVDLVGLTKSSYAINNECYTKPFPYNPGAVAEALDVEALKDAIKASQQKEIDYKTFLNRAVAAGCCWYQVFIRGKKVVYFGRNGDTHIELFPSSK